MLSRFRPQAGRASRIALVLAVLSALAAAQNTCPPGIYPCVGQGPFRLFIGPLNDTVPAGAQDFFWAVRDANQDFDGKNFLDLSTQGHWSSSDQTVATVDNSGTATTYKQGSTTITFHSGPFTSSTILNVGPAVVSFITVTPKNPTVSLPAGTKSFTAVATYTDGTTLDITSDGATSWTADDTGVVTMSGPVATAVGAGSTYVNATFQSVTGFTGINSGMTFLGICPTNPPAEPAGGFIGFTAIGYFGPTSGNCADPNATDVSNFVNWSSSNTTVADVDRFGFATALSAGSATITAASSPLTASTTMTVSPPTLDFIDIQPFSDVTIDEGGAQTYRAIGSYSDKSTQDLTNSVTWVSSDQTVATISSMPPSSGVAHALNTVGSTQISLTFGSTCTDLCLPDPVNLNVAAPVLESITVTPANPSIAKGNAEQFTATGTYSSGAPQDLTSSVMWSSSSTSVATINSSGLAATAANTGPTTITATLGQISGAATLTVTPALLQSIDIAPTTPPTIKTGQTYQFTATGHYSDSTTSDITNSVTWQSTSTGIATINSSGIATAVALNAGSTTIQASSGLISSSNTPLLSVAVLQSIAVTPGSPSVSVGGTQQFTATGTYTDSTQMDLTASVTWNSDHASVAAICDVNTSCPDKGQAQALAAGSAGVTATKGSVNSGPVTLTVNTNSATLQSITIAPLHSFVVVTQNKPFTATGHYSDGSTRTLTSLVSWSSSKTSTASITNAGLVTGNAAGTCTITATINLDGTHSASTDVTVTLF
jgi:uncharacterized protein YjdB